MLFPFVIGTTRTHGKSGETENCRLSRKKEMLQMKHDEKIEN